MNTARVLLLGSVCALAVAGCESAPEAGDEGTTPVTVTVLISGGVSELGYEYDAPARHLLYLPLMTTDTTGEIRGRLARSWEHSEDGRTWTYHLRSDVRWQDGVPVTAADIEFTHNLLSHPEVLYRNPDAVEIDVLDDSTLTIVYHDRIVNPLDDYSVFYPKHLLADLDPANISEWEFWEHPVGNGPYRFVRREPGVAIELEANPDFYADRPRIDRVVLRFGGASDLAELLAGNADIRAWPASNAAIEALTGDERFRIYPLVGGAMTALWWNHRSPFFSDARVRRALSMALDRSELIAVNAKPAEPELGLDVPATARQVRRGDVLPPLRCDPVHARALLDSAGWRDDDGDGVRERDGRPFRFTALMEAEDRNAVVVKEHFRHVGVEMELITRDFIAVRAGIRSGEFEAAFHRFPGNFFADWFGPGSVIGYRDTLFARLWTDARETWIPDERDRKHRLAMPVFQAAMPLAILYYDARSVIARRYVCGLGLNRSLPLMYMDQLWTEEGSRSAAVAADSST